MTLHHRLFKRISHGKVILALIWMGVGGVVSRAAPQAGAVAGDQHREGSPWILYDVGSCRDVVYDAVRDCVWFGGDKVGRIDLKTGDVEVVSQNSHVLNLALEKDHLWIATWQNGLSLFDIPSGALMKYTVENTMQGERKGLQYNSVWHLAVEPGIVWLFSDNQLSAWGLTRFKYAETDPLLKWVTYRAAPARRDGKPVAGLASNLNTGMTFHKGRRVIFTDDGRYQFFDDNGQFDPPNRLLPPVGETFAVVNPRGEKGVYAHARRSPRSAFYGFDGTNIWFEAPLDGTPWDRNVAVPLLCWNPNTQTYTYFSRAATESYPGAGDGLRGVFPAMLVDGDDVWLVRDPSITLGPGGITRYSLQKREFTQYPGTVRAGIAGFQNYGGICSAPHSVLFATDHGVLRYQKSNVYPKITRSQPSPDAVGVALQKELYVEFDMAMNPGSVHGGSVELYANGARVEAQVTYDPQQQRAVVTIPNRLPAGMPCELVVKSLVQAENGNPLSWTRIAFTPQ